jgi:hypothetical protein
MAKTRKKGIQRSTGVCLECDGARKRHQERIRAATPRGADGTLVEAILESDPAPARLLAGLLREDRDRMGFTFARSWSEDVEFVLARIERHERKPWREAFRATRAAWEAAWSDTAGPGWALTPELAAWSSDEADVPTGLVAD